MDDYASSDCCGYWWGGSCPVDELYNKLTERGIYDFTVKATGKIGNKEVNFVEYDSRWAHDESRWMYDMDVSVDDACFNSPLERCMVYKTALKRELLAALLEEAKEGDGKNVG